MKTLKPGLRLKSSVCATEIMVIRAPSLDAVLACGGTEMLSISEAVPAGGSVAPAHAQGTLEASGATSSTGSRSRCPAT